MKPKKLAKAMNEGIPRQFYVGESTSIFLSDSKELAPSGKPRKMYLKIPFANKSKVAGLRQIPVFGRQDRWLDLNETEVQMRLFDEFLDVIDPKSADRFCGKWNLPNQKVTCFLDSILWAAASVRWINDVILAINSHDTESIAKWITYESESKNAIQVIFSPDETFVSAERHWVGIIYDIPHLTISTPVSAALKLVITKDQPEFGWPRREQQILFAQDYIRVILNGLAKEIELGVDKQWVPKSNSYVYKCQYFVNSGWQAIISHLLALFFNEKSFGTCKKPACKQMFTRKRSDKEFCSKTCSEWARQNIGTIRKYRQNE